MYCSLVRCVQFFGCPSRMRTGACRTCLSCTSTTTRMSPGMDMVPGEQLKCRGLHRSQHHQWARRIRRSRAVYCGSPPSAFAANRTDALDRSVAGAGERTRTRDEDLFAMMRHVHPATVSDRDTNRDPEADARRAKQEERERVERQRMFEWLERRTEPLPSRVSSRAVAGDKTCVDDDRGYAYASPTGVASVRSTPGKSAGTAALFSEASEALFREQVLADEQERGAPGSLEWVKSSMVPLASDAQQLRKAFGPTGSSEVPSPSSYTGPVRLVPPQDLSAVCRVQEARPAVPLPEKHYEVPPAYPHASVHTRPYAPGEVGSLFSPQRFPRQAETSSLYLPPRDRQVRLDMATWYSKMSETPTTLPSSTSSASSSSGQHVGPSARGAGVLLPEVFGDGASDL